MAQTQAISVKSVARSGLTDLVQLRHVANLIFELPGTHRIAQSKRRHTRFGLRDDRG